MCKVIPLEGKDKVNKASFVKEMSAYLGFFLNGIFSSLLFLNPLTVMWGKSEPHQTPVNGADFHFMVKEGRLQGESDMVWAECEMQGSNKSLIFT